MSTAENTERRANWKSNLLERLSNPNQLRGFLTALVLLVGYLAIYQPFETHMAATKRSLAEAKKRLNLANDVEQLRKQFSPVEARLQQQTDSKEWEQYMLDEIRKFPLKLDSFKPGDPRDLGPYKAVTMQIELTGSYVDLDHFLHWLESNKRLFRVDDVKISVKSSSSEHSLTMKLIVLGLMG
jgi:Tfp pilus assembly protein PilO